MDSEYHKNLYLLYVNGQRLTQIYFISWTVNITKSYLCYFFQVGDSE